MLLFYEAIAKSNCLMKRTELLSKRIKLQHLKVVAAVAQWGSMAKAARHLAISQPVVSKVIAEIEGLLEVCCSIAPPRA